jgi:hypothetical protein
MDAHAFSSSTTIPVSGTVVVPLVNSTEADIVILNGEFHVVMGGASLETGSDTHINI